MPPPRHARELRRPEGRRQWHYEVPGNRTECLKRRRRERQFDGGGEVFIVLYMECTYFLFLPFYGQPACVQLVVSGNRGEQCDREWIKVGLVRAVDQIGPFAVFVYAVEDISRNPHLQLRDIQTPAVGRDSGDARGYKREDVAELTQLFCHGAHLLSVHPVCIESRLGITKGYGYLLPRNSLLEVSTNVSTGQSKSNTVHFVYHRTLDT